MASPDAPVFLAQFEATPEIKAIVGVDEETDPFGDILLQDRIDRLFELLSQSMRDRANQESVNPIPLSSRPVSNYYPVGSDNYIMSIIGGQGGIGKKPVYIVDSDDERSTMHLNKGCHNATTCVSYDTACAQGRFICQRCKLE